MPVFLIIFVTLFSPYVLAKPPLDLSLDFLKNQNQNQSQSQSQNQNQNNFQNDNKNIFLKSKIFLFCIFLLSNKNNS